MTFLRHNLAILLQQPFKLTVLLVCLAGLLVVLLLLRQRQRTRRIALEQVETRRLSFLELAMHQLGAPLASIRWWVVILKDSSASAENKTEALSQITAATGRLDAI